MSKFTLTKKGRMGAIVLYTLALAMIFFEVGYIYGHREKIPYADEVPATSNTDAQPANPSEEYIDDNIIESETAKFMIKRYGNGIAVYEYDRMIRVVDVDFNMLRPEDKNILEIGIGADTMQEVSEILEDYIS